MYHHIARPTPVVCALAGSLTTVGVGGIAVRAITTFTSYKLHPSLNLPTFLIAVLCTTAGGVWTAWLIIRSLRQRIAALASENADLRAERIAHAELLQAVMDADAQSEVNKVKLDKVIRMLENLRANETTQQLAPVRSIKGGA